MVQYAVVVVFSLFFIAFGVLFFSITLAINSSQGPDTQLRLLLTLATQTHALRQFRRYVLEGRSRVSFLLTVMGGCFFFTSL